MLLLRQSEYFLGQGQSQAALMHLEEARAQEPESTQVIFHLHLPVNKRIKSFNGLTSLSSPTTGVSGKGFLAPGSMFLNSSLACVTTHVLARALLHVLA